MKYQTYPAYKDSGVEWLGEIPTDWDVWKLNHFAPIITCGVAATPDYIDDGVIFLSAQNVKNRSVDLSKGFKYISKEKHTELTKNRAPKNGDILLSRVGTVGEVCIVDVDFEFSIFVSLTHLRLNQKICTNRFFVFLCESTYTKSLHSSVTLVGGGVGNLNVNDLREYRLPLPSQDEQQKIAQFLDHETAKIDTLIEKQQRLIELLKEKRQAVISHAVTKGLNPHAPMKDSGVEWLGEVPEGWAVTRAKFVSTIFVPQRNKPELNDEAGVAWATMEDMKGTYIEKTKNYVDGASAKIAGSKTLQAGAVIASCVGNFDVASINKIDVIINQQLQAFIPHSIKAEYLRETIGISKNYFELIGTAATLVYVNQQGFENLPVLVPTSDEQEKICEHIEKKCHEFQQLISFSEQAIELMQERRTALISAAVTGKIDVRSWGNL